MFLRTTLVVAVLAASAALAAPTGATPTEAGTACNLLQLTATTGGSNIEPAPDVTGDRVVFTSPGNFGGGNPDGNEEVWLRDRSAGTTTQITDTTGGGSNSADHPDISDDGTRIVFSTNRNIGGTNPQLNVEVYLFRTDTSAFTPVTATTGSSATSASISDDGTQIAFASDADPTGDNPEHNIEIFRHTVNGSTSQLTETTDNRGNRNPTLDADGSRVVFTSGDDIGGGNPDGSFEVFLWDASGGTTQITNSASERSGFPTISDNGTLIAFESRADLTGHNADGTSEVFRHLTTTATTTQLTDTTAGESFSPSISDDGARIAFESEADLGGLNPEGNSEIWLLDSAGISPITSSTTGDNFNSAMVGNGSGVAFEAGAPTAGNPEGNPEIVLALCGPPQRCDGQNVTVHLAFGQSPTNGADVILGTSGADSVLALGGNDRFCGVAGDDTFVGGGGNDRAFGGQGHDTLLGQGGNDLLDGGAGNDTLVGQTARDTCHGRAGNDIAPTCEVRTGIP